MITERRGRVVNSPASYSGGPGFKSRSRQPAILIEVFSRSQWSRGLRRRSAATWLLGSRVRIPLRAQMFVSCVCMLCCPVWVETSATG
jgi:hypothetical protein